MFKRRTLLQATAASAVPLAFTSRIARAADPKKMRLQLSWLPTVEYAPMWIGLEKGYFKDGGLDLSYKAGGPNAPSPLVVVAAGNADLGGTDWLSFLDALGRGNDFVIVGAAYQTSVLGIISLKKKPILTAKDLLGAKILAQGPQEKTAIEATLSLAKLDSKDWTMIPAGFSPEPLLAGQGDGYTAYGTNQPITLERMGLKRDVDFFFRSFAELGFRSYGGLAFCKREYLQQNRDAVAAYYKGLKKGAAENAKDPAVGAKLAVEKYGADFGLNIGQQTRQNELQIGFMRSGNAAFYAVDRSVMLNEMYPTARAAGRTNLPDVDKIADYSVAKDA